MDRKAGTETELYEQSNSASDLQSYVFNSDVNCLYAKSLTLLRARTCLVWICLPVSHPPMQPITLFLRSTLHAVWRAHVEQTLAVANARLQSAEVMARLSEQLKPAKLARVSAGKRLLDQLRSLQNDLANSTHDLSRAQKYYGEEERHAHDIRHKARNAAERWVIGREGVHGESIQK